MATKRSKNSKLIQSYRKERKRVQSLIRRYENKYGEVAINIPSIPKRITQASIRRLQKITPAKVKSKTYLPHPDTGERIKLTSALKRNLNIPKQVQQSIVTESVSENRPEQPVNDLPDFTDIVLQNFNNLIDLYPERMQEIVKNWSAKVLEQVGGDRTKLAESIQQASESGNIATYQEAYNMSLVYENLVHMTHYLDISAAEKQEILAEIDVSNDFDNELYL